MLLATRTIEKLWGYDALPAPFAAQAGDAAGKRIGEIWFEPPAQLPELLVKYIFASDKLSVQCHPDDDQAEAAGLGRKGKEECWLVVAAEPGAKLGVGFREHVDAARMRAAALDGSIEELLDWREVEPGDFFYIPAGTVHAIGPACSMIEVQQNSDVTYRLYDYGRDRELHLERGIEVACGSPYDESLHRKLPASGHVSLVDGPRFTLDLVHGVADTGLLYAYASQLLVAPLQGEVLVAGEVVAPGQCALAPDLASVTFAPEGRALVAAPC